MKKILTISALAFFSAFAYAQKPEAVDLGLSVKWASFNVDAAAPEEPGGYYSWGEVETKTDYRYPTYKWSKGNDHSYTKYCTDPDFGFEGFSDGKKQLDPEDDVAAVKWGDGWRMPTTKELFELRSKCKWEYAKSNGMEGYRVTGHNGNSIFLPMGGTMSSSQPRKEPNWLGKGATYNTSTLSEKNPMGAQGIFLYSGSASRQDLRRAGGRMVRPVHE